MIANGPCSRQFQRPPSQTLDGPNFLVPSIHFFGQVNNLTHIYITATSGIDQINLKKGKINLKKSKRKAGFTKATVREGLTKHFQGDESTVDAVFATIQANLPTKEVASLSLTGIKEKSDK